MIPQNFLTTSANNGYPGSMRTVQTPLMTSVNPLATSVLPPGAQSAPIYQSLVPLPAPIFSAFIATSSEPDAPHTEKQPSKPADNLIDFLDDAPQQGIASNTIVQEHLLGQSSVPIGQTLADLTRSGSIHHVAAVSKQKMEAEIQSILNTLWSFRTVQEQADAVCGCANEVTYTYSYQSATFNEPQMKNLRQIVKNLYNLNIRGMWLSLFEQTVAEISLEVNILSNVETLESAIDELKSLFVLLVDLLRPTTIKPLSSHAAGVVRGLTMIVGLKLLEVMHSPQANIAISQSSAAPNTLFDLGDLLQSNSSNNARNEFTLRQQIMALIIDKLMENDACYWAKALVHPSLSDIGNDWLSKVLVPNTNAKEIEITSLLSQVNWDLLPQLSLEQVKSALLLPIQNFMETAVAKNYLSLFSFLSKILLLISHNFPSLTVNCVAILLRSAWPAKMACQPILQLMNWSGLNVEETITLFGELYHFFQIQMKPIDFVQAPWQTKTTHRDWFVNYLLANHAIVAAMYQLDTASGQKSAPVGFPILNTFTKLAAHYRKLRASHAVSFDLEKLIVSELFYITFVHRVQQGQSVPLYTQLKNEAFQAMVKICTIEPQYFSHVMTELGTTLAAVNVDVLKLFEACQHSLDKWIVDDVSMHIISYFLNRKSMQPSQAVDTIDYSLTVYLCTDNRVQFSQGVSELAANIASRVISSVNWMNCLPAIRAKVILSVIAGKHVIAPAWLVQTLKRLVQKNIISATALDPQTTFKFLNLPETKVVSVLVDEFSVIKLLLAISLVDMSNSSNVPSQYDIAWAKQWGLFTRLHRLIAERTDDNSYRGLISETLSSLVIAMSKKQLSPDVWNDITAMIGILCNMNQQSLISEAVVASLSRQVTTSNFYNCLNFWAKLLIPLLGGKNKKSEELVNQFLHGAFIQQANFAEYFTLFPLKILPIRDIHRYVTSNVPWIAYLAVWGFGGVFPPKRSGPEDTNIKNSILGNWQDMALYLGDSILAIPFWEQFFRVYFMVQERHGDSSYFTQQAKDSLNEHFMQMASKFQGDRTKPFYQMYYSFTTWAKDVIFATNLLQDRTSEVFQAFVRLVPPTFPIGMNEPAIAPPQSEAELTAEEQTNFVLSLLPTRTPPPTHVFDAEKKLFEGFTKEFNLNLKALLAYAKQPEGTAIPAIEDLSVCLSQYYEVIESLWIFEKAFLSLIEQQYQNTPQVSSVSIPCHLGADCLEPATVQLEVTRITSPYAHIREDLTVNRQQFTRALTQFFDMSRTIANSIVILDHVKNHLLLQESAESKFMAQVLFFKLLPLILNQEAPPFSPIHTALIRLAVEIGDKYIKHGGPHPQLAMLKMILEAKKTSFDAPSPTLSASSGNLAVSTTTLSGDFGLKTLSLNQSTNVPNSSAGVPVFTETRQELFRLLSPHHFLNAEGWSTYLQMLNMFLGSTTELSVNEEKIIAEQFEFEKCIAILLSNPNGTDELYRMFELSLKKPGLIEIASHLFNQLINFDFPNNINRVLSIALKQTNGNNSHIIHIVEQWSKNIIDRGLFTLDLAITLLKTLRGVFPLPTEHANNAAIHIFKQVLLYSPFKSKLVDENQHIFQHPPALAPSASWDEVERITKSALANDLPVTQFDNLINAITETIIGACPKLIDRFWYLYIDSIAPYVIKHQDRIDFARVSSIVTRLPWQDATFHIKDPFVLVHMSKHADLIPQIVQTIFVRLDWSAFAKALEPVNFPALTGEEMQEISYSYRDKHVLHFLKMLMDFNLMAPESIPESLRRINFALSHNPNAVKEKAYLFDWRKVPLKEFKEVFTGQTLIRLVKDVKMTQDPSKQLIENLILLKDIAKFVGHSEPMFACFREAKSILFFHMQSVETEDHWLIPYQDQVKIVSAVLVPLTTQYYEIQENEDHELHLEQLNAGHTLLFKHTEISPEIRDYDEEQDEEPMVMLLSCIKGTEGEAASWQWGNSYLAPIKFSNSRLPPQIIPLTGEPESDKFIAAHNQAFESFHEKLYSLIVHYSNSVPSFVCLKVFNYAFKALSSKPKVLVQIIENTIHNYFGASLSDKEVFKHAAIALKFPIAKWTSIAQAAAENSCALTLRLLIEKMKLYLHSLKQTGQKAPAEWSSMEVLYEVALEFVLKFKPHETKSFDLLCLWFFVLEMVAQELDPVLLTAQIVDLLNLLRGQWQLYSGSLSMFTKRKVVKEMTANARNITAHVPEGEAGSDDYYKMLLELAAKSCELYLLRIFMYRNKRQNIWPIDRAVANENGLIINENDLKKMHDSLLALRNKDRYNRFSQFFSEIESILSPLTDIAHFEQTLIKSLAAIGPYLSNMVPAVHESDLQQAPRSPIMTPLRASTNELRKSVNLSLHSTDARDTSAALNSSHGVLAGDEPLIDFGGLDLSSSSNSNNNTSTVFVGNNYSNNGQNNNSSANQGEKLIDFDL